MVRIIKTLTIGIRPQFSKELDYELKKLGIEPIKTEFYKTEFMGKEMSRYYAIIQCYEKEEKELLKCLKIFNHDTTVKY